MNEPPNLRNPPQHIKHTELRRTGESAYRSVCPVCGKGVLFVRRDQESLALVNLDGCVICGQTFIYTDKEINGEPVIDVVRKTAEKPS
jgi:hypothetical protein